MSKKTFKTAFVKMTRDPEKFAQHLEDKLNELADEGWEIVRNDYDTKKGTLIVAYKQDAQGMPGMQGMMVPVPAGHPLAELLSRMTGRGTPDMSPEAERILDQVFEAARTLPPDVHNNKRIARAVEMTARKFPNPLLRKVTDEVKQYCAKHQKEDHPNEGPCDSIKNLTIVVEEFEKHISRSVV